MQRSKDSVSTFSLLKSIRFLPLFICQFLGAFNDTLIRTAMVTMVTYLSSDLSDIAKSIIITLALALFTVPFVIFSAIGGQLADKFNKARLIQAIKFTSIIVTLIAISGFYLHSYILLLVAIFLTGIESTIFGPVKYSIIPDHLDEKELLIGNGLIEAGTFIAILIGMIAGGIIISNNEGVSLTNFSLLIIASIGFLSSLFIPNTVRASPNLKLNFNIINETLKCVNFARKDRNAFLSILGISWFWLIGGIFMSQMPSFTKDTLSGDNSVFILLITIFSLGTGLGSMICNRLLSGRIDTQYVPISMLVMTFFLFCLWITSSYFPENANLGGIHYFLSTFKGVAVCLEVLMMSIFSGIYIVPLYSFLQIKARKSYRSRIIAANNIVSACFIVSATLITMLLLAVGVSVSTLIFILMLTNFFTAIYICRILPDTVIKSVLQTLFRLLYRVEVIGMENFYKAGKKVLIIANHASFLDPPLLGAFLPERLVFAIDTGQAGSFWVNPFLSYLRAFPIDPTNPMATKALIDQLKNNKPVVIFPEGRITVTGSLMKIYEGPGLIADRAGAKLLPIRLEGPQYSPFSRLHGKVRLKLFPKIKITILEPQEIKVPDNLLGRRRRHLIGKALYDIMSDMMFKGSENNQTLFQSLIEAKTQYGSKYKIIEDADHNKLNYNRFLLSIFLLGKKVKKYTDHKEHTGILMPNAVSTTVLFFSIQAYGRVPAMLNYSTGVKNIISSCVAAGIKVVFTARKFIDKANFHHIIDALQETGIKVIFLEDIRTSIRFFDKIYAFVVSKFPEYFYRKINERNTPSSNSPAVVLFTSGSEGTPKGVVLSHANIQANIKQAACRIDFSSYDKVFNALPIFHSFGLTAGFLLPIISGIKVFLYPSPLHYRIIPETVYGCNATALLGTDTFLNGFAKHAHPYDFYSIRYIVAGAEKLRDSTKKLYMEKFGIRILEGYGATEASPIISLNTPMHYKAGSVGRLVPNIKYRLDPVKGIKKGGRLIIYGPNIMSGYLKFDKPGVLEKPEYLVDGKVQKGWYDTGDIVEIDDDGFITIQGRAKRFAKVAGEMISLAAVEEYIYRLYPESILAVISIASVKKAEVIVLFTDNTSITREQIHAFFKQYGLSELFIPKIIKYKEDIPVLPTGKIDYVTLKNEADSEPDEDDLLLFRGDLKEDAE
jgi:acyl-[acyl-carrier-protein]-phospholipid O-acyltransferase / long-chain-fatty-acid--[acyl-carrier-protein] ligase